MASATNFPTNSTSTGSGDVEWDNPSLAEASGGGEATVEVIDSNEIVTSDLLIYDFGFSVPVDATINGIVVEVRRSYSKTEAHVDDNIADFNAYLTREASGTYNGDISDNQSAGTIWTAEEFGTQTFGASNSNWGFASLTPAQVNSSDFGFFFAGIFNIPSGDNTVTGSVDFIRVTVHYTFPQTLLPGTVASAESVPSPTLNQTIGAGTIASAETVYGPQVNQSVAPSTIASAESVNAPIVVPGAITVNPDTVATAEAVNSPQVNQSIAPDTTATNEAVNSPAIVFVVAPGAIASAESFSQPQLNQVIFPGTVASGEAFFQPSLNLKVLPGTIASGEAVYSPTIPDPGLRLLVDWNNDGEFTGEYDDVTDYTLVRAGVSCERGKDQISFLAPPMAGRLGAELHNQSRLFSAENEASPLFEYLEPGRLVRFYIRFNSTDYFFYTGLIDSLPQHPGKDKLSVEIVSIGTLTRLVGKKVSTQLYTNIKTDVAIGHLLNAAGWSSLQRVLSTGKTTLHYWWLDDEDAFNALLTLLATEGPGAAIYEDGRGRIVFEDRNYRLRETRSNTSQFTFTAGEHIRAFDYDRGIKDVINKCSLEVVTREIQDSSVVWEYGSRLTLAPNETKVIQARASSGNPFTNAQVPSPSSGVNEVQTFFTAGSPTGGTVGVSFDGVEAEHVAKNALAFPLGATPATIQTVLENISTIGAGNVAVSGGNFGTNAVAVTFQGALAKKDVPLLSFTSQLTGGTNPSVSVEETTKGAEPDYTLVGGSLASLTLDRTSGAYVTITIVAGSAGAVLDGLQLRAQLVSVIASNQLKNTIDASASIAKYGDHPYNPGIRNEINAAFAQDYCNAVVYLYKDPRPTVSLEIFGTNDTLKLQQYSREVSDRITIVEPQTGLNADFFIEKPSHNAIGSGLVKTRFGCEKAIPNNFMVFNEIVLGTSLFGF
jgi:hypothetical protein